MMYSVEYIMTVTNSVDIFHSCENSDGITRVLYLVRCKTGDTLSVNKGVRKFGRIFHMCCFLSNKSQLVRIRSIFPQPCSISLNFSRLTLSVEYFRRDVIGEYRCEKFGRIFHV